MRHLLYRELVAAARHLHPAKDPLRAAEARQCLLSGERRSRESMSTVAAVSDRTLDAPHPTKRGVVAWLALAAVALTIATSGIVFTEPAPIDILTIGLVVLLPVVGLVQFNRGLLAYGA